MIILRTLFKPNKAKIFSSIMSQQNKKIIYNPMNTFFWKKEKKETEQMKKFKEINQEYKALKEIKQFMVKTDKTKSFISDAEKQKQEKAVLKAVKDYLDTYKFDDKFDELRFINLLSTVSYTYDNSKVLSDPRFADLIQEVAQDLRSFIDYRSITIFLNFCSYNDVNRPLIWENFNGVIRNKAEKFSFDEKLSILSSCNENNSAGYH